MPRKVDLDLRNLSAGERLWAWRQGRGITYRAAAKRLGLGAGHYYDMERGDRALEGKTIGIAREVILTLPALLRLARKRARMALRVAATKVGCSHVVFLRLERAADERIVNFWVARGAQFPQGLNEQGRK